MAVGDAAAEPPERAYQSGFRAMLVGEGTVSTEVGEAFPYVDPTGDALYFSVVVDGNWQHQRLVVSRSNGQGWGHPQALPFSNDLRYSDRAPRLSPDGSTMVLVITDHPTGVGGDDLYVSHWRNGGWTEPRNLGPAVNTPEYEYGPTLSPDGTFLYFTSHRSGEGDTYRIPVAELDLEP